MRDRTKQILAQGLGRSWLGAFIAVLALGLPCLFARAADCPKSYGAFSRGSGRAAAEVDLHAPEAAMRARLSSGHKLNEFSYEVRPDKKRGPEARLLVLHGARQAGAKRQEIGMISYMVPRDGTTLWINKSDTIEQYRRNGVNEAILARLLRENPGIQRICTSQLAETNHDLVDAALRRTRDPEAAIRETAAYKVRARLGFARIVRGTIRPKSFGFCVER